MYENLKLYISTSLGTKEEEVTLETQSLADHLSSLAPGYCLSIYSDNVNVCFVHRTHTEFVFKNSREIRVYQLDDIESLNNYIKL